MSEYWFKIGYFAATVAVCKISGRRGHPHQPFFLSENWLNVLSYSIKIWTDLPSVLSQFTRLTDRRTDGQTDRQTEKQTEICSLDRVCIPCSAVKVRVFK